MQDKEISQKVLSIIKEGRIKPLPKWRFFLKTSLLWLSGVLSLLAGAIAFSVIIHLLRFNDWDAYEYINKDFTSFVLLTLPYLWILFLGLFIFVCDFNFKHTRRGYRFRLPLVAAASILFSVFLGLILYSVGVGRMIDYVLSDRLPVYSRFVNRRPFFWSHPEEGRLAGRILRPGFAAEFELIDFQGQTWLIDGSNARIVPPARVETDFVVRLIGRLETKNEERLIFHADLVLPAEHFGPGPKKGMHCPKGKGNCREKNR